MTDFTTDHIDFTPQVTGHKSRRVRAHQREYYAYFALIFLATLPLTCLTWTLSTLRRMELPERGPLRTAWAQAQIITPRIFSA
ncbi:PufQ cytochrome subunit [Jannaschia faecimaris]|uniref:PufQ cytochrome subunit n=1 Tax=Jannaschia faecimaris TaxID=1244108 RepID=A0A1H3TDA1_9RHOB|nr:cytochrome PufQ [Jannaschia faecimaris]SDZ48232.1 PufQ cytochrome subunit [Jannaschia faecimaris]